MREVHIESSESGTMEMVQSGKCLVLKYRPGFGFLALRLKAGYGSTSVTPELGLRGVEKGRYMEILTLQSGRMGELYIQ